MSDVELVYDLDCPNIKKARANLLKAFATAGLERVADPRHECRMSGV